MNTASRLLSKHSAKVKEEKARKHNCCYMCLMPTQHRVDTCPYRKQCLICSKIHHFNNHPRQEINEYYKNREQNPKENDYWKTLQTLKYLMTNIIKVTSMLELKKKTKTKQL